VVVILIFEQYHRPYVIITDIKKAAIGSLN
jgi:hypothetical protein